MGSLLNLSKLAIIYMPNIPNMLRLLFVTLPLASPQAHAW